jgi:membrane protease YdiL (CAAX protease family)
MNKQLKLGLTLFLIGFVGILSMLTVSIPFPEEALQKFSPETLKVLSLVQPSILLLLAVIAGTILHTKVGLSVPTIAAVLKIEPPQIKFASQIKWGVLLGILIGIVVAVVAFVFRPVIPQELVEFNNKITLTPVARLCYGGFTEELLMRFGFMTFIVWVVSKITKKLNRSTYWMGIIASTLLFAVGHFPIVFVTIAHPTLLLLLYVLIGNSIAGMVFGWLYWKKGLESACVAHMFFHVFVIVANLFGFQ